MVNATNWSCVEVAVAIFIACIPSFNTLIIYRFPKLQQLLGLKGEATSSSKTYGSSSRRVYNNLSIEAHDSLKLKPVITIGQNQAEAESSRSRPQERIMHAGIQVTTDVSVNDKRV